jgi:hypothetical protein
MDVSGAYEPARCEYITSWTVVKTRWHLTIDTAEKAALTTIAAQCPNIPVTIKPAASSNEE